MSSFKSKEQYLSLTVYVVMAVLDHIATKGDLNNTQVLFCIIFSMHSLLAGAFVLLTCFRISLDMIFP